MSVDLTEAVDYYRSIDADLPMRFADSYAQAVQQVWAHPTAIAEYLPGWRRVLLRTFPYLLVYAVDDEQIHVVGLFHTRRNPEFIKQTVGSRGDR
ncbi:type II toxin-antitoxin system RelE/ParE family toxin [Nocardioides sp.]|uniref:type II toxin-antitoxin system RelE/ParE family toxin n=1 Tax=Nocardioides sp. TaxID=35761 RepID=UPI0039E613AB